MHTGIIGFGRFGRALGGLLDDAGSPWSALDPSAAIPAQARVSGLGDLVQRSEVVVVAVPVPVIAATLEALRPLVTADHLVVDVGSVKVGPERAFITTFDAAVPWAATHPLFGPASLARGERPLRVVVCPNTKQPAATVRATRFYTRLGCEVVELDARTHDLAMADTHVLAFFVAKALLDVGAEDHPLAPPSFQAMARTIDAVRSDAGHLFSAIQAQNEFASASRRRFLDALHNLDEQLDAPGGPADEQVFAIPDLGARAPDLLQTRDLIDELDRELVALLARRSQLSLRAGRAKGPNAIRDPGREASMLAERARWAQDCDLDATAVHDVFEAILRSSRTLQRKRRS